MIGDDETNFPHKSSLTNRHVANLRKAFADKSSIDIKLSKIQISNMIQSGGFLASIPFGSTAAASASALHNNNTVLIISNDEIKDIIEIVKSLEDSNLLPEEVSETIQNEAKEQRGGFLSMLLGTLGASLLENILAGKAINRAGEGIVRASYGNKKGKRIARAGYRNKKDF